MYRVVHYLIHKPDQDHPDIETSQNLLELPFSLMLDHEFKKRNVSVQIQEVTFDSLKDPVPAFLKKYGIEKDHFVCFDEMICKKFSPIFSRALIEMKNNVAALWIAIGAKPVIGRFPMATFTKSGFVCPDLKYPLRNPIDVAKKAYKVSQDGVKNELDGILQNEVHFPDTNIVQGQVIAIEYVHSSILDALQATIEKIPKPMSALIYIDDRQIADFAPMTIHSAFAGRKQPFVIQRSQEFSIGNAQKWLCEPQTRKNDLCIIGKNHRSNGIQTEIVIHVLPESCPDCEHSDEDPVVASRATALFIYAKYQRSDCPNCTYEPEQKTKASLDSEMATNESAANMLKSEEADNVSLTELMEVETDETKPDETQSKLLTNAGSNMTPELSEAKENLVAEKAAEVNGNSKTIDKSSDLENGEKASEHHKALKGL